jgi:hypothetical protein
MLSYLCTLGQLTIFSLKWEQCLAWLSMQHGTWHMVNAEQIFVEDNDDDDSEDDKLILAFTPRSSLMLLFD